MASQITSVSTVCSTVGSGADQRKHQSSASLAFVREFTSDRWTIRTKGPVTRKMFPFDDVIMWGTNINPHEMVYLVLEIKWRLRIINNLISHIFVVISKLIYYWFMNKPGLTLLELRLKYPRRTRSISWLLMPRLRSSPGDQQPWYWQCGINNDLKDLNYFLYVRSEKL